jgi:hypothetical protein
MKEKRRKEKRKERENAMGKESFPGTGPTLLAVPRVAVLRCN